MELKQIGSTLEIKVTEPSTNADAAGTPLVDFGGGHLEVVNTSDPATVIASKEVDPSSPTGGQEVTIEVDVPVIGGTVQDLTVNLVAKDLNGNKSTVLSGNLVIDTLAPAPYV